MFAMIRFPLGEEIPESLKLRVGVADLVARSASYVRRCRKTGVSVRPPCVRIIIDFCRENMNPGHVLEATETLKT